MKTLKDIVIRHTKHDIKLPAPVFLVKNWVIDGAPASDKHISKAEKKKLVQQNREMSMKEYEESFYGRMDKLKADHIVERIMQAKASRSYGRHRPVKVVIFSPWYEDLSQLAHFLYTDHRLSDQAIAEHWGAYRSTELNRFRTCEKKVRRCRVCGHENGVASTRCERRLLKVCYEDQIWANRMFVDGFGERGELLKQHDAAWRYHLQVGWSDRNS